MLAKIHDEAFQDISRAAFEDICSLFPDREDLVVTDLGCGSGILLELLKSRCLKKEGRYGVDLSPECIELARARAPEANISTGSIYGYTFPKSDLVCAVGEVLNYQEDESIDQNGRVRGLLERIHFSLKPEGLFLFDVILEDRSVNLHYQNFTQTGRYLVAMESRAEEHFMEREISIYLKNQDGLFERSHETHYLHLFKRDEIESLLELAGFNFTSQTNYGDLELGLSRRAYICSREEE